jgi:hypothetical protein
MEKRTINVVTMNVDNLLNDFTIHQKPSTNVEFFGSTRDRRVYVQYKSGQSYIYSNVPGHLIADMEVAESIGSFIAQLIVKPNIYPMLKYPNRLITYVSDVVDDDQYIEEEEW